MTPASPKYPTSTESSDGPAYLGRVRLVILREIHCQQPAVPRRRSARVRWVSKFAANVVDLGSLRVPPHLRGVALDSPRKIHSVYQKMCTFVCVTNVVPQLLSTPHPYLANTTRLSPTSSSPPRNTSSYLANTAVPHLQLPSTQHLLLPRQHRLLANTAVPHILIPHVLLPRQHRPAVPHMRHVYLPPRQQMQHHRRRGAGKMRGQLSQLGRLLQ